ncbi:MAG: hypothetical protein RQ751_11265, partial [Longimicrobiales bacterium]|nr:hypothetical protein [Longimicrobiales bacterium]
MSSPPDVAVGRALLASRALPVLLLDADTVVRAASPAATERLGGAPLEGSPLRARVAEEDRPLLAQICAAAGRGEAQEPAPGTGDVPGVIRVWERGGE